MFLIFCLALYLFVLKLLSFKASKSFNHSHARVLFLSFSVQAIQQKAAFLTSQCQEYMQRVKMILQSVSTAHSLHRGHLTLKFNCSKYLYIICDCNCSVVVMCDLIAGTSHGGREAAAHGCRNLGSDEALRQRSATNACAERCLQKVRQDSLV